jgi:hypothetical protein
MSQVDLHPGVILLSLQTRAERAGLAHDSSFLAFVPGGAKRFWSWPIARSRAQSLQESLEADLSALCLLGCMSTLHRIHDLSCQSAGTII